MTSGYVKDAAIISEMARTLKNLSETELNDQDIRLREYRRAGVFREDDLVRLDTRARRNEKYRRLMGI
jgi:hypothetical protein